MTATVLLIAAVACGPSKGKATPAPTVTLATEPPRTTTTNPYAIPAVIDAAYVNRVLAGLDAVMGDVVRLVVQTRTIPRPAYDRLRAIYGDDQNLQLSIDILQSDIRKGLATYKPQPGNQVSTVTRLITVLPACVFAQVNRDYTAVGTTSTASNTQWVALKPLDLSRDPDDHNRTHWALHYDGYTETRGQPADPCAK